MVGCALAGMVGLALTMQAQAATMSGRPDSGVGPIRGGDDQIAGFRVLDGGSADAPSMRLADGNEMASEKRSDSPLAGDRWAIPPNQRPREPGAAVDARMSMRLDGGDGPSFGMGGIGGALLRVTNALID